MKQARYYRRRMLLMVWNTVFNALTLLTNGVIVAGVMRHWHDVPDQGSTEKICRKSERAA